MPGGGRICRAEGIGTQAMLLGDGSTCLLLESEPALMGRPGMKGLAEPSRRLAKPGGDVSFGFA